MFLTAVNRLGGCLHMMEQTIMFPPKPRNTSQEINHPLELGRVDQVTVTVDQVTEAQRRRI